MRHNQPDTTKHREHRATTNQYYQKGIRVGRESFWREGKGREKWKVIKRVKRHNKGQLESSTDKDNDKGALLYKYIICIIGGIASFQFYPGNLPMPIVQKRTE